MATTTATAGTCATRAGRGTGRSAVRWRATADGKVEAAALAGRSGHVGGGGEPRGESGRRAVLRGFTRLTHCARLAIRPHARRVEAERASCASAGGRARAKRSEVFVAEPGARLCAATARPCAQGGGSQPAREGKLARQGREARAEHRRARWGLLARRRRARQGGLLFSKLALPRAPWLRAATTAGRRSRGRRSRCVAQVPRQDVTGLVVACKRHRGTRWSFSSALPWAERRGRQCVPMSSPKRVAARGSSLPIRPPRSASMRCRRDSIASM